MKKKLLILIVWLCNLVPLTYSQQYYYLKSNNDTVIFQKNNNYYFEFKKSLSKDSQDSIIYLLYNNIDTLEYFENGHGKINIQNDSLLTIFNSFSNSFKYSSPELSIDSNSIYYTDNSIILKVKSNISIENILNQYSIEYEKLEKINVVDGLYYIELVDNSDVFNIIHILFNSGNFIYVEPSFYINNGLTATENVIDYTSNPSFVNQWWLHEDHEANIYIQDAWEISAGNPKIKIGVLDTGIDFSLNDIKNNCEKGVSTVEYNFYPQLHGFGSPDTYIESKMHGTGIASILVAENNNINLLGIAHRSKVYPIRVCRSQVFHVPLNPDVPDITKEDDPNPPTYISMMGLYFNLFWVLEGINHAYQQNLDIINCSFIIGSQSEALEDAINNISQTGRNGLGTVVVFAAGNSNKDYIHKLASLESVICVGGVSKCGYRCIKDTLCSGMPIGTGSNYGNALDVVAPADRFIGLWGGSNSTWSIGSGTSYAAPIVAGIASLILDVNPCLTSFEVREIIEKTARKVHPSDYIYTTTSAHPNGPWNKFVGYGIVNAYEAVLMAISYANSGSYYMGEEIITENTTWDRDFYTTKDIEVEFGAVLNISSRISFAPGTSLKIKYGGKVVIDQGTLTSSCQNSPWQGIIVEGISSNSQNDVPLIQGMLVLNNSTISNAICGIMVGTPNDEYTSGGIVIANNTNFINNGIGVQFNPYVFQIGQTTEKNKSKFLNCNFTVNNGFLTSKMIFKSHVELLGVNGILFKGCDFSLISYNYSGEEPLYSRVGISSYNSNFTVIPNCSSLVLIGEGCDEEDILNHSIFSGLNYGIVAESSDNIFNIEIKSNDFINNDFGIYISGVNNPKILKNRFTIGKTNESITDSPTGLYIQNSSGFRIEENHFINNQLNVNNHIGIYLKNSGSDNNIVYKNFFVNLTIGQFFDGLNYSTSNSTYGLKSICNNNLSNNTNDILIGCDPEQNYNGINLYQSGLSTISGIQTRTSAGNVFTTPLEIDMQYVNTTRRVINYYFDLQTNLVNPTEYFDIIKIEAPSNLCLSKVYALNSITIQSELTNINFNYGNLKYNYNQLIDAGNTEELIKLIQDEWSEDIWNLRTELLGQSPYLSQEAILSVAEENLLPPALLLEICIANPDATKDEGFLEKLRCCIPTPLPEYMINLIKASWENKTLRTDMEEQLSAFKTYKDELFNYLTEIMLSDTIYDYSNIINHLGTRGSYSDYLSMAEIAINQDDFDQANLYLDILENNSEKLSEEEALEIASFRDYIAIRESLFLDSTTIYQLDSTQIASLETYASSNNYRGAILARNILCFLYDICIDDVPTPPKMLRIGSNSNNNQNTIPFIASVKVMPNPAHEYASFIWDMKSFDKNAILYIYDQNGKIIVTQPIDTKQGQWVWNIKNVPNGVYVYTLKSEQLILYSGKIIVNK